MCFVIILSTLVLISIQLCTSNGVATVWDNPIHGCEGQVTIYVWSYSVHKTKYFNGWHGGTECSITALQLPDLFLSCPLSVRMLFCILSYPAVFLWVFYSLLLPFKNMSVAGLVNLNCSLVWMCVCPLMYYRPTYGFILTLHPVFLG